MFFFSFSKNQWKKFLTSWTLFRFNTISFWTTNIALLTEATFNTLHGTNDSFILVVTSSWASWSTCIILLKSQWTNSCSKNLPFKNWIERNKIIYQLEVVLLDIFQLLHIFHFHLEDILLYKCNQLYRVLYKSDLCLAMHKYFGIH